MKDDSTVYVGLDVHKESITVAYAIDAGEVELPGKVGTTKVEIDRLCKRLQSKASLQLDFFLQGVVRLEKQLFEKG